MSIYTAKDRTPYTYLIGWSKLDKWYYGVQYGKGVHPNNLWVTYFTSSELIEDFRKTHGEPDIIKVIRIFDCPIKASDWEVKVLRRLGVPRNLKFLNGHCGGAGYNATLQSAKVNANTRVVWFKHEQKHKRVAIDDPILLTDLIEPPRKLSNTPKRKRIVSNKERQQRSERSKGLVMVLDTITGQYYRVSMEEFNNNPNLVGVNTGKKWAHLSPKTKEHRDKLSEAHKEKVTAIDKITGKKLQITKEEFDNNRDRYDGHTKGMFPAKDKFGNRYYISNQDPRYLSGELVHARAKHKIPK